MTKIALIVLSVGLLAVAGLTVFLATWDIPAPVGKIEKVIPASRFDKK